MYRFVGLVLAIVVIMSVLVAGCSSGAASTEDAATFYKNNPITIVVNGGAGGTTDFCGRLFASNWSQFTGGPTPEVKVMSGGGGIEGDNYIYNNAAPDGLTIGITTHSADITGPLITGAAGVKFDARELGYIGAFGFSPYGIVQRYDSPYKTIKDLQAAKGLVFGGTAAGGAAHLGVALMIETLKLDAKLNLGYENTELGLAAKRGEIEGFCNAAATVTQLVNDKIVTPSWVYSSAESKWLPGTPTFAQLVQLNPEQKIVNQFIIDLGGWKSMFLPPKVPADRLAFLRQTFDKMLATPAVIEQAKSKLPVFEKPLTGQQLADGLNTIMAMPADQKSAAQNLLKKYTK